MTYNPFTKTASLGTRHRRELPDARMPQARLRPAPGDSMPAAAHRRSGTNWCCSTSTEHWPIRRPTWPELSTACCPARGRAPRAARRTLRPLASHGARGLIGRAFGIVARRRRVTRRCGRSSSREYESALCDASALFPTMDGNTGCTRRAQVCCGGSSPTRSRASPDPLVRALGLAQRAACVVSGDTTPHAKPHPAPLLHALQSAGKTVMKRAVYVGDDLRDVQAGRAAGTTHGGRGLWLSRRNRIRSNSGVPITSSSAPDELLRLIRQ